MFRPHQLQTADDRTISHQHIQLATIDGVPFHPFNVFAHGFQYGGQMLFAGHVPLRFVSVRERSVHGALVQRAQKLGNIFDNKVVPSALFTVSCIILSERMLFCVLGQTEYFFYNMSCLPVSTRLQHTAHVDVQIMTFLSFQHITCFM